MKRLQLTFVTENGTKSTISIPEPREDLTEAQVQTAMQSIVAANAFTPKGYRLTGIAGAKLVATETTVLIEI